MKGRKMDINFEAKIGNAEIMIKACDHRVDAGRVLEMAAAFPASGTPNATAVEAFLQPLRKIGQADLDELVAHLPATPLPGGYRHFRLFRADDGQEWHSSLIIEENGRPFTIHNVIFGALNHPTLQLSSWSTTEWMPDMVPGVLDLEIGFVAELRTKRFRLQL